MYRHIVALSTLLVSAYYRRATRRPSDSTVAASGPVLLVSSHRNGLVDAPVLFALTPRQVRFVAKHQLFEMPLLGFFTRHCGAIPIHRQGDGISMEVNAPSFEAIASVLAEGGLVAVFPEGTSLGEGETRPLKTGTARMAFEAEAGSGFELGLVLQPVALVYEAPERFQSRVEVRFAPAFDLSPWRRAFEEDEREAVRALTDHLAEILERLQRDPWSEEEKSLWRLARSAGHAAAPDLEPGTEFRALLERLDRERPYDRRDLALRLTRLEHRLGVRGLVLQDLETRPSLGRNVLRLAIGLGLGLPLGLVGALVWLPPFLVARFLIRLLPLRRDKYVTSLLLAAVVLFPLWWSALVLFAWSRLGPAPAVALLLLLPLTGLAWVLLAKSRELLAKDLAHLVARFSPERLRLFREERRELADELQRLSTEESMPGLQN